MCEFFSQKRCADSLSVCAQPPACTRMVICTHVKYPVVHVRVQWITETRKDNEIDASVFMR